MKKAGTIKLFVDAHVMDAGFQGSRTFIREIYSVLSHKEDIRLYIGAYDTTNLEKEFAGCGQVNFIRYKSKSRTTRLAYDISMIISKYKIRYAHFQYIVPLLKNCRYIVTTHDVLFNEYPDDFSAAYRRGKNFLYKYGANRADILTTVSAWSKKSIQQYLGIAPEKIHIVPNAVNERFFRPIEKEYAADIISRQYGFGKYILYLGRYEPRKNHVLLLNAWYELGLYKAGYQLVMPGDKTLAVPEFDRALSALPDNIRSFVKINDSIKDEDLPSLYRAASLFVYPSKGEGFGIPPLEAAAVKTEVLCSSSAAMQDFSFFADRQFDPADYQAFKTKLSAALTEPAAIKTLESIAAAVQQKYSWKQSAETLYELIKNDHHNLTK
jgi:glycosyltransferase involved in cell wall biosynthesis